MKLPTHLKKAALDYARVEFNPLATLVTFYGSLLIGAAITLSFCPQFGVGPIGGGHGISHWVMPYGPWVCGAFCAAVFTGLGTLLSALSLNSAQWRWVMRHHYWLALPPVAFSFLVFMLSKKLWGLEGMHEGPSYYLAWNLTAVVTCWLVLSTIEKLHLKTRNSFATAQKGR